MPPPKLLDQLRAHLCVQHYALRTERTYVEWVRRYILFHAKRHPRDMGAPELEAFLTHLAVERGVSASTQNQAKAALLFLYKSVLGMPDLPWLSDVVAARGGRRRLPVVLTPREARELLMQLSGPVGLAASLLYGSGLRLMECLRLRVKDVEFERRELVVREGKGGKDRVTVLPENLIAPLRQQLTHARALHQKDLAAGRGGVWLPDALALKYPTRRAPGAGSGCFPRRCCPPTRARARSGATTCTSRACSAPWRSPPAAPASTSPAPRTCCAIPSPPTCCRPATTSAPCRSCSAMPT